jgi:hypothetical protein
MNELATIFLKISQLLLNTYDDNYEETKNKLEFELSLAKSIIEERRCKESIISMETKILQNHLLELEKTIRKAFANTAEKPIKE